MMTDVNVVKETRGSWAGLVSAGAALTIGLVVGLQVPACGTTSKPDDFCEGCIDSGGFVWNCHKNYNDAYVGSVCADSSEDAQAVASDCQVSYGVRCGIQGCWPEMWPCDGTGETAAGTTGGGPTGICDGWQPSAYVSFSSGVYHVTASSIEDLTVNSAPLVVCDTARFEPLTTGKYTVTGASSGTFAYKLGLRNGDIPQTLNSMPLVDAIDGVQAFTDLYLGGETNYTLVVKRSGTNLTLLYEIVP